MHTGAHNAVTAQRRAVPGAPPATTKGRRLAAGALALAAALTLSACGTFDPAARRATPEATGTTAYTPLHELAHRTADRYGVPRELVHRVIMRESRYNPAARNGPYWGLMQIHPQTARTMGFRGEPHELLDPATNLRYGVRYLRGAWLVSNGNLDAAVGWYARGYYYEARRLGLLDETGLRGDRFAAR